jgi:myo-inositol-1(or 4)-monophosphatase
MLNTAIKAARAAADILIDNFGKIESDDIIEKSKNDFLTFVDEQTEKKIIEIIHNDFPSHSILAEESGKSSQSSAYQWIIDPLDGTKNYISGVPVFAISIGMRYGDVMEVGVVLDPIRDELFHAKQSGGAFLNGKPIQIAQKTELIDCLLGTGFPFKSKPNLKNYVNSFAEMFLNSSGIRRMGSAAIDLAYCAAGRFDGFWELGLSPWDMAAGSLIIEEAGGVISDFWNKPDYLKNGYVAAGNKNVHHQILSILHKHFQEDKI